MQTEAPKSSCMSPEQLPQCAAGECEHAVCVLYRAIDTMTDSLIVEREARERVLSTTQAVMVAQQNEYDDLAGLAVLAAKLAWSLEGDKGEDDGRIERQVLKKIASMGLLEVVLEAQQPKTEG